MGSSPSKSTETAPSTISSQIVSFDTTATPIKNTGPCTYRMPSGETFSEWIRTSPWKGTTEIGRGTFGSAYLVVSNEKVFVLKYMFKRTATSIFYQPDLIENECDMLVKLLGEPAAVQMLAAQIEDDKAFILYHWIPGKTLYQWKKEEHTSEEKAFIKLKLKEGLSRIHSNNIVHDDIRDQNIFIPDNLSEHSPFFLDFGAARLRKSETNVQPNITALDDLLKEIPTSGGRRNKRRRTSKTLDHRLPIERKAEA